MEQALESFLCSIDNVGLCVLEFSKDVTRHILGNVGKVSLQAFCQILGDIEATKEKVDVVLRKKSLDKRDEMCDFSRRKDIANPCLLNKFI